MRNLIAFFRRFQVFLIFSLLQVIALSIYMNFSDFARIQALTTISSVNASMMEMRHAVTKHFNLDDNNKKLAKENAWLREQLKTSNYQIKRNRLFIEDTAFDRVFDYIPANVIQSTFDKRNNYMTIDVGRIHGIQKNDGVMSSEGIVGIVHTVGERYSLVTTILSKDINIDVMLENNGAFGLLKWDQNSPKFVQVSGINSDVWIKKWSKVVTRGGSGIFPKGIPVGKVYFRKKMESKPLWEIQVAVACDFRRVQQVYVVRNLHKNQIQAMQQAIPEDKEEEIF